MKLVLYSVLLVASSTVMRASITESISFDLSTLHAGSTLSGVFTLSNNPAPGDTAMAQLSFSDPQDYGASSVTATIQLGNGVPSGFTVGFSGITFSNPSGNSFTKNNTLQVFGAAKCASFPCTSTGGFQDNSPAAFTATYSIAPVPEPGYTLIIATSLLALAWLARRRELR